MRVTLNQDEIFEAVSDYLRDKLNLGDAASIEISFTAGRGPKGYSADVDITYPKSEQASKFVAAPVHDEVAADPAGLSSNPHAEALSVSTETTPDESVVAAGAKSADDIFN